MNQYHLFHLELLQQTYNDLLTYYPFNAIDLSHQEQEFLDNYLNLINQFENFSEGYIEKGQTFCLTWIRAYPDLTPVLPRDLLWFFSGECLHYMPDEEIDIFQKLDEQRFEAESDESSFDYSKARAALFNLTTPTENNNKLH